MEINLEINLKAGVVKIGQRSLEASTITLDKARTISSEIWEAFGAFKDVTIVTLSSHLRVSDRFCQRIIEDIWERTQTTLILVRTNEGFLATRGFEELKEVGNIYPESVFSPN